MAVSITWATGVIYVPRLDMPLIQASPEVRQLDASAFRLELKDLEDDAEGMPFLDTHRHVTEVTLSGILYARFIEVINGYTIEFEAGTYGVSVVGANTNFLDVKVANSVSLLGNNSAGLVRAQSVTQDVTDAMNAQGYTIARADLIDQLDVNTADSVAEWTQLVRRISDNKMLVNITTQRLELYDDSGAVVLRSWPLSTFGGEDVVTNGGVQVERGLPT